MHGASIQNMGNNAHNYGSLTGKDNGSSKVQDLKIMTPPDPIETIEPITIENTFENPFDFSAVQNPFSIEMPVEIDNPFSMEMQIELEIPAVAPEMAANPQNNGYFSATPTNPLAGQTATATPAKTDEASKKMVSPQEMAEKLKCSTCESRTYKDVSNDPGVSFKSSTKVSKDMAFSAVSSHEKQHVSRNQDKAEKEGKKIVSQSVTLSSGKCGECNDTYISGGTTRTVTKSEDSQRPLAYDPEKAFNFEI